MQFLSFSIFQEDVTETDIIDIVKDHGLVNHQTIIDKQRVSIPNIVIYPTEWKIGLRMLFQMLW